MVAGVALAEAVDAAFPGQPLILKWPNDLLLDGAKLAGILLERRDQKVVIGFGVNLASSPEVADRRVAHLGKQMTPQAFAPVLAGSMARILTLWRSTQPNAFAQAWLARAHAIGTELRVHSEGAEPLAGRFEGIEPDGTLRLKLHDGTMELVRAGDVEL
jgi:BirA family biotin operon repressor/biotin-[acetyl-CoA-carboxylase] ligase